MLLAQSAATVSPAGFAALAIIVGCLTCVVVMLCVRVSGLPDPATAPKDTTDLFSLPTKADHADLAARVAILETRFGGLVQVSTLAELADATEARVDGIKAALVECMAEVKAVREDVGVVTKEAETYAAGVDRRLLALEGPDLSEHPC